MISRGKGIYICNTWTIFTRWEDWARWISVLIPWTSSTHTVGMIPTPAIYLVGSSTKNKPVSSAPMTAACAIPADGTGPCDVVIVGTERERKVPIWLPSCKSFSLNRKFRCHCKFSVFQYIELHHPNLVSCPIIKDTPN